MTAQHTLPHLKIVIVGHVDHGKSTLVGRLFHDTDSLPAGKVEQIRANCEKRGMPFEWSFLMDALQVERDQGITVDISHIWFSTPTRRYVLIDAPGHKEFLKNMISGAASSEAAILVIDAREGVQEQSRRHGYLLHLLGVKQVAVVLNKMDLVGYDEGAFARVRDEYAQYLASIHVTPSFFIPVAARDGDNIASRSAHMPWYAGPTVLEALDRFVPEAPLADHPLRFPVQDVYKFDARRIIAGRIESGRIRVHDEISISPRNRGARVKSIELFGAAQPVTEAVAGQSIGITLDEQLFIERGQTISHFDGAPLLSNRFHAKLFWLGDHPLAAGRRYTIKLGTLAVAGELTEIHQVIHTEDLSSSAVTEVPRHAVAEVTFTVKGLAALDDFRANPHTGRFVVVEDYRIVGGGIIDLDGIQDQRVAAHAVKSRNLYAVDFKVTPEQRAQYNGHLGGVLWFTGLSGSGKSTLALELEQRLFAKGYQVYVLDGDNIRRGLNADLGFSPEDRSENIRRVGEVAALFADAGVIVITSFISPYREDRRVARTTCPDKFNLVYIKADVATCEERDVKGLYKKARAGEIKNFTGISAPYEEPENPDLVIDTAGQDVDHCVAQLLEYVEHNFVAPIKGKKHAA